MCCLVSVYSCFVCAIVVFIVFGALCGSCVMVLFFSFSYYMSVTVSC